MMRLTRVVCAALSVLAGCACGRSIELGRDVRIAATDSSTGGTPGDAQAECTITPCGGKIYACGDCLDNDADGLTDSYDPECLGPCDNTEDSYFGGIPGQNNAPCKQDCYFDQDTGSGNDDCHWSQKCDPRSLAPDYPPSGDSQCAYDLSTSIPGTTATCADLVSQQSATCLATCLPVTPNGCDCFGCCELPAGSGNNVWIGSTSGGVGSCDAAHLDDPQACHPCTRVTSCFNDCNPCEICAGRPQPSPDCNPATDAQCSNGRQPCGLPGQDTCPEQQYCISGCCEQAPQ